MTSRIEPVQARLWLSGELGCEHVDQLKAEIERGGWPVVLHLEELSLVDIEGIRFLKQCEAKGISVQQCSPFIRTWMSRDRKLTAERPHKKKGRAGLEGEQGVDNRRTRIGPKTNIVLVHGAWAEGSSWGRVIPNIGGKCLRE